MLAILSAMREENTLLSASLKNVTTKVLGSRSYQFGELFGQEVVVVFSHWGKVAAASTVTVLITEFGATEIIFTGVAGAVSQKLHVGDIVIGDRLYQHDMDVRPILPRHTIPLLDVAAMPSSAGRVSQLELAAKTFLANDLETMVDEAYRRSLSLIDKQCLVGAIASGDQFISSSERVEDLRQRLPDVLCVEMEGGAVAQVCAEFDVPFSVVRTISDSADEAAAVDFPVFVERVASQYSLGIIKRFIESL